MSRILNKKGWAETERKKAEATAGLAAHLSETIMGHTPFSPSTQEAEGGKPL